MSVDPNRPSAHAEALAEAISARDANNLYRASRYFEDRERYRSFCAQYAVMRVVDDRIDAIPSRLTLSRDELERERQVVAAWQKVVELSFAEKPVDSVLCECCDHPDAGALAEALRFGLSRFPVPKQLWSNFFSAMVFDLERHRFRTYEEFLTYAEGATVAPTTIFLYLLTAGRDQNGRYRPPPSFDLLAAGRALGLFAYLGHIVRDLAADLATGKEGMLYVAQEDLHRHGLTEEILFRDLSVRRASGSVRALAASLIERAREYLGEGRVLLRTLQGTQTPDCAFILELTIGLYVETIDKIEHCEYDSFRGDHQLTDAEKIGIAAAVWRRMGVVGPDPFPRSSPIETAT